MSALIEPGKAEMAHKTLQAVVDSFNASLKEWQETTGCDVNFGWAYKYNEDESKKRLEILTISHPVYSKPPPESLQPGMSAAGQTLRRG